jgi:hypothetical protein
MIEARASLVHTASASELSPFERQYQTVLALRKTHRMMELASRHKEIVRLRMLKVAKINRSPAAARVASKILPLPAFAHRIEVARVPARNLSVVRPLTVKPMPVIVKFTVHRTVTQTHVAAVHPAPARPPMSMPVDTAAVAKPAAVANPVAVAKPAAPVNEPPAAAATTDQAQADPSTAAPEDAISLAVANLEKSVSAASSAIANRDGSASGAAKPLAKP